MNISRSSVRVCAHKHKASSKCSCPTNQHILCWRRHKHVYMCQGKG